MRQAGRWLALLLLLAATVAPARAAELLPWLHVDGLVDLRLVQTGSTTGWRDAGQGKLRWGGDADGGRTLLRLGEISLVPNVRLSSEWDVNALLRLDGGQPAAFGVGEAYLRWRPVSTGDWRFTMRAGFLIPPFSLENDGLAWTSRATLTWSAIDSWLGEEVRATGVEGRAEWRVSPRDRIEFLGAVFGGNDPAGTILARRGWALHDQTATTTTRLRTPDSLPGDPRRVDGSVRPFLEMDDRAGWYGGVAWIREDAFRFAVDHYDNLGDPDVAEKGVTDWRTHFTTLGGTVELPLETTVTAQGLRGYTSLRRFSPIGTRFQSTYLLVSHLLGADPESKHRVSARWDWFRTRNDAVATAVLRGEVGQGGTLAWVWRPLPPLRFTLELQHVRTDRDLRSASPATGTTRENMLQASVRVFF